MGQIFLFLMVGVLIGLVFVGHIHRYFWDRRSWWQRTLRLPVQTGQFRDSIEVTSRPYYDPVLRDLYVRDHLQRDRGVRPPRISHIPEYGSYLGRGDPILEDKAVRDYERRMETKMFTLLQQTTYTGDPVELDPDVLKEVIQKLQEHLDTQIIHGFNPAESLREDILPFRYRYGELYNADDGSPYTNPTIS